ncbi:DegT/DnrJ/EryC1/StrS family aminotransferase [Aliifodinibius salicampi]|uniref:DegT/DnrJ/EryC1/StrS family aminotransferase n=1 Tax=Fodinibius salicampi TaxID=1920655 RepID=A0ABT3Q0D5_9BACT|nr:DegT/DnrJ/EryC1/StrS family aminotransferase [Fodinibius salicampi]MCW9713579.1 DegT/DnrJ/EryC1/StrS family aminotransferase [Fodinibius salicampi]
MKNVPFLNLKDYNKRYEDDIQASLNRVISSGWYLLGDEKKSFELEFSDFIGVDYTIGVGSGLDALKIILKAYQVMGHCKDGDEVIVPANTFIASILAITDSDLKPVLVEPDEKTYNIDPDLIKENITPRTKAIMIVHLYGQNAYSKKIKKLCDKYNLKLIEDAAQAHGARFKGRRIGSLGDAAAFSFYPGKNLGAMGDAGAICTDNQELAECCRMLGNYGAASKYRYKHKGFNSRMDELQAGVLRVKLQGLEDDNQRRREVSNFYLENISNEKIELPGQQNATTVLKDESHVWHLFVVRVKNRDQFINHLQEHGVEASIHYPIAPNEQAGYPKLQNLSLPITERLHREVVSLPMSPVLKREDLQQVVQAVESY